MSQFSKDIDSLSVKGAEKLDSATFDRISGYIQSGKIRAEDVDSLSKGVQHVDSAAFDRISKAIERENVQSPVQEKPKTAGDQLLEFGRKGVEAAFPRLTQNTTGKITPSEIGKDLLRGSLDALSFGPRVTISGPQTLYQTIRDVANTGDLNTLKNIPERVLENVKRTETPTGTGALGLAEDIARGPFIALPGAGQIGSGVVGAASHIPFGVGAKVASVAPKIGEAVGPRLGALAAGVGDIAMGAGMGTAESVARNEGVDPLGSGIGGVLGSINPVLRGVKGVANLWSDKNVGKNIIEHYQHDLLHGTDEQKVTALQFLKNYTETEQAAARKMNEMVNGFASGKGVTLDPSKNISQNVRDQSKWITPSQPGLLSDVPELTRWLRPKAPKDFGLLQVGKAVGGPIFWPSLAKDIAEKYPHVAADITRVIPNGTGTIIRNLGTAGYGSQQ